MTMFSSATLREKRDLCKPRGVTNVPFVTRSDIVFQHGAMFAHRLVQCQKKGGNYGTLYSPTAELTLTYSRYKLLVDVVRHRYPSLDTTRGGTK
jgi:hypothetical protein